MLHKTRVLKALYGNAKRQIRILLHIKSRPKAPVLAQSIETVVDRHAWICQRLVDLWPTGLDLKEMSVCEIGPGDCLAAAAFFIGKGARHVDLVEQEPPAVNEKQRQVLIKLKDQGFPISLEVITGDASLQLNDRLITYHKQYMENYTVSDTHSLVFSHCVLEHVEDLDTVFQASFRSLRTGGKMLQVVDLGGHGQFEDPIPPLDFQTYPDWLHDWMYPVYYRATRRFLEDYRQAAVRAGFRNVEIRSLRTIDKKHVESIHKILRPAAQKQPLEDISVIEFALTATK